MTRFDHQRTKSLGELIAGTNNSLEAELSRPDFTPEVRGVLAVAHITQRGDLIPRNQVRVGLDTLLLDHLGFTPTDLSWAKDLFRNEVPQFDIPYGFILTDGKSRGRMGEFQVAPDGVTQFRNPLEGATFAIVLEVRDRKPEIIGLLAVKSCSPERLEAALSDIVEMIKDLDVGDKFAPRAPGEPSLSERLRAGFAAMSDAGFLDGEPDEATA